MRTSIVLTLTGPDRVGIVEDVTRILLAADANVETSRMAHLGGEFAILMLLSMPAERIDHIDEAFADLTERGYTVSTHETVREHARPHTGWSPYRIEVRGADHEGIIHDIAQGLSRSGINIESMETGTIAAPVSGTPLFTMRAVVAVPHSLGEAEWMTELEEACGQANVDVAISVAEQDWDEAR